MHVFTQYQLLKREVEYGRNQNGTAANPAKAILIKPLQCKLYKKAHASSRQKDKKDQNGTAAPLTEVIRLM